MLYLRPQRVYKPSAASQYNSDDYLAHLLDQMDESLYRLRLETPRGTSITEDNSQITCYAHIFDKRDGTELTDLLKGRGWRPTWLLDDKPIDSARISEEGYLLTLETTHLPAIYQTVTLQARDTDILLALTDEAQDKAWFQRVIASGDFPTHLLQASEKLLNISRLDKIRVEGLEEIKQDLAKALTSELDASAQQTLAEAVKRAEELDKQIKVGGRNLIRAGYFEKVYFRSDTDKLISYDDKDKKITYIGKASRWNSWVWLSDMEDVTTINLRKAIGEYTLSFSVRGRGTVSFEVVGNYKTNDSDYKTTVQTLTEDWQRVSCPFTRSAEDSSLFCLYNDKPETGDWVQFADDWKLERGTVATDWTPAPEDVAESVSKVSKSFEDLATHPLTVDENGFWKIWSVKQQQYVTTQYQSRGEDAGRYLGRAKRIHPDLNGNYLLEPEGSSWLTAKEGDYVYLVGDLSNRGGDKDTYYIVREHKSKTVWEVYNIKGKSPVLTLDSQYHLLADGEMVSMQSLKGADGQNGAKGEDGKDGHTPNLWLDEQHRLVADGKLVSAVSLKGEDGKDGQPGQDGAKGEDGKDGHTPNLWLDEQHRLVADGKLVSAVSLKGEDGKDGQPGQDGAKGEDGKDGHTPNLWLDEQHRLVADGKLVSAVSLKGEDGKDGQPGQDGAKGEDGKDGHTPHIDWDGTKLIIDNMAPVDLRGQQGEAGHNPAPEDVLHAQGFQEMLDGAVWDEVKPVRDDLSTANNNIASLSKRSLTLQQKEDLGYLTSVLRLKMAGGEGDKKTLEGLTLQRYIALSSDNKTVTAYLASDALDAVLKAGIVDFGKPTEREQVAINHDGTGHVGNLYFTGNQIDFRTSRDDDPYLSIGADESQFIDHFIATARIDNTPVSVRSVTLTTSTTSYERTVDVANDGTRLTVSIGDLNVATFNGAKTRLTLDGEVLAEWRGTVSVSGRGGAGGIVIEPQYNETPYTASNLSYERVVKAGRHAIRLEIVQPTDGATATARGLRVRRRYDTGRQQSVLTKSGLRLFGSPDRYLDVDYRTTYRAYLGNGRFYDYSNDDLVRIKGGAKIDRLKVDKIEGAGAHLPSIVTPQLGLGGQTTLYPKYDEWVLTSDAKDQYISFSGLSAEIGRSIYIQTRRKAYLYVNGHSFYGLPGSSTSQNQWLSNNTTYRFVRASSDSWLVTASSSPYPWT